MKPWIEDETFLAKWANNELSKEELHLFEQSPEYSDFVQASNSLNNFEAPAYNEQAALAKLKARIADSKQNKKVPLIRLLPYAIAASIALFLGFGFYYNYFTNYNIEIIAKQQLRHDLPDGSYINLNSNSSISYNSNDWDKERDITLRGEAFFNVTKGEQFTVSAGKTLIRVLGTSFNIAQNTDGTEVVCYSGKVSVSKHNEKIILKPGQSVLINNSNSFINGQTKLSHPIWLSAHVTLSNTALPIVLEQLEEIYHVEIQGKHETVENFSGTFPTDDLETALKQVLRPFGINYSVDPSGKYITLKK